MRGIFTFVACFLLIVAILISWDIDSRQAFVVGVLAYMACDTWISTWWPK